MHAVCALAAVCACTISAGLGVDAAAHLGLVSTACWQTITATVLHHALQDVLNVNSWQESRSRGCGSRFG